MNQTREAPRRDTFQGPATGRELRGVEPRSSLYLRRRERARGDAVFARTAKGWLAVGHIVERGGLRVFVKRVDSRCHRLHSPPAYALEERTLQQLATARVQVVEVAETDTGRVLRAPLRSFAEQGLPVHRGGFERQVALPLARWQVEDGRQGRLFVEGAE
jgi:hypothetical protein